MSINFEGMFDVAIIGGGLAGLINSILLSREGFSVILFEAKKYPFHRVCGEYISNEVIPFLEENELFPSHLHPSKVTKFHLTSTSGRVLKMDLDLGGFGVSRYQFDFWLAEKAREYGVEIREEERVDSLTFKNDVFDLGTNKADEKAKIVVGSYGKRSKLDKQLNRRFISKRSPYIGVKYHVKTDLVDPNLIELHNFSGGYCGVSKVENSTFNICYLSHRNNLLDRKDVRLMEQEVLYRNPFLKKLFLESDFLFDKPEVINEISFEPKEPVLNHVLMSGDAAGMITPLCGNGMAMAIHSAKILSRLIESFLRKELSRDQMERQYSSEWKKHFARRHWAGRKIQRLFGSPSSSEFAVSLGNTFKPIANYLMSQTHGKPFK